MQRNSPSSFYLNINVISWFTPLAATHRHRGLAIWRIVVEPLWVHKRWDKEIKVSWQHAQPILTRHLLINTLLTREPSQEPFYPQSSVFLSNINTVWYKLWWKRVDFTAQLLVKHTVSVLRLQLHFKHANIDLCLKQEDHVTEQASYVTHSPQIEL